MPLTKQQILDEFSNLPLAKLQRLHSYSTYLIVPEEDMLTNVTMEQMMIKANALADELWPEWTDRSETDFGMFLVELIALFSEKDFWYINAFANQSLLAKMKVYSMAYIRAVEMGFRPDVFTSASGTFSLNFVAGTIAVYLEGDLVLLAADGTKFTNTSQITVPTTVGVFNYVTVLKQGEYTSESLIFNGRSIDIRTTGVDAETIQLVINGITWTKVAVFGQSDASSTHFMVLPEEDGKCSIWFGDGTYGKKPLVSDKIDLKYLFCKGADGNVPLQATTVSKSVVSRKCQAGTMTIAPTDGVSGSSLTKLINETQNYFNYRHSCLNEVSTKAWLLEQPEVAKANVFTSGSSVSYYWYSKLGAAPTLLQQSTLQARIAPLVSNGFTPAYTSTVFINPGPIAATAYFLDGFVESEIESLVQQIIQDFTDPLVQNDYGKGFLQSEVVLSCVSRIEGLSNLVFTSISGGPANDVVCSVNELLVRVATGNITLTMVKV
jgi:hypothetical protein